MKSKKILRQLREQSSRLHYYNGMAPFPPYDTDYVKDVDKLINKIMEDKKHDYDEDPVYSCKYCKNIHIVTDELDNDICMNCGSTNEIVEYKDIYEYLKLKNGDNT